MRGLHRRPAPGNEVPDDRDHGENEQNMYETADGEDKEPERPKDQKYHGNREKHRRPPSERYVQWVCGGSFEPPVLRLTCYAWCATLGTLHLAFGFNVLSTARALPRHGTSVSRETCRPYSPGLDWNRCDSAHRPVPGPQELRDDATTRRRDDATTRRRDDATTRRGYYSWRW